MKAINNVGRRLRTRMLASLRESATGRHSPLVCDSQSSHTIRDTVVTTSQHVLLKEFDFGVDAKQLLLFQNERAVLKHLQGSPDSWQYVAVCLFHDLNTEVRTAHLLYEYAFDASVDLQRWRQQERLPLLPQLEEELCRAYDWLHQQGVAHNDVKPANVVLQHLHDASRVRLKLVDFERGCVGPTTASAHPGAVSVEAAPAHQRATLAGLQLDIPFHYAHPDRVARTVDSGPPPVWAGSQAQPNPRHTDPDPHDLDVPLAEAQYWDSYAVALLLLETEAMWQRQSVPLAATGEALDTAVSLAMLREADVSALLVQRGTWVDTALRHTSLSPRIYQTVVRSRSSHRFFKQKSRADEASTHCGLFQALQCWPSAVEP